MYIFFSNFFPKFFYPIFFLNFFLFKFFFHQSIKNNHFKIKIKIIFLPTSLKWSHSLQVNVFFKFFSKIFLFNFFFQFFFLFKFFFHQSIKNNYFKIDIKIIFLPTSLKWPHSLHVNFLFKFLSKIFLFNFFCSIFFSNFSLINRLKIIISYAPLHAYD